MVRKIFGGYKINFSQVQDKTLGEVFDTKDLSPSEMTKKIWEYVKAHNLSKK